VHSEVLTEEFARRCKLILIARPPSTIAAFLAPLCEYNDYEVCPSWGGKFHLTCTHSQFPEYDTTPVARESTDAKINNCLHHLFPSGYPVSISLVHD
jgi:hypothetical protein